MNLLDVMQTRKKADPGSPASPKVVASDRVVASMPPNRNASPPQPEAQRPAAGARKEESGSDDDGNGEDDERRISIFLNETPVEKAEDEKFLGKWRYQKIKELGRGAYGTAYLCKRNNKDGTKVGQEVDQSDKVVAKVLAFPSASHKAAKFAINEIRCLQQLRHPNIIGYLDSLEGDLSCVIVMEYADGGDLRSRVKRHDAARRPFEEATAWHIFLQIAMGLEFMHSQNTLHRDLKSANILLFSSIGLVKIADFGFSRHYEETVSAAVAGTMLGTPYYFAPELWRNERYSNKADMFALGIILYEILTFSRPFKADRGLKELMKQTLSSPYQPPEGYSAEMLDVLAKLLAKDPKDRPSARDLFRLKSVRDHLRQQIEVMRQSATGSEPSVVWWMETGEELLRRVPSDTSESPPQGSSATPKPDVPALGGSSAPKPLPKSQGHVKKYISKQWQPRFLEIKDGALLLSRAEGDGPPRRLPLSEVSAVSAIAEQSANAPFVFAIHTVGNRCTWMQAADSTECSDWISSIRSAMQLIVGC